jgi:hypothetical protein
LTIEAGVVLKFSGDAGIAVSGTLIANGTVDLPIYFTSMQQNPTKVALNFPHALCNI